jgi:hypothetical protein
VINRSSLPSNCWNIGKRSLGYLGDGGVGSTDSVAQCGAIPGSQRGPNTSGDLRLHDFMLPSRPVIAIPRILRGTQRGFLTDNASVHLN